MKNTEAIHQLIHALSKAEKRHFKMTAARYSKNKNNYLLLFDAIDQQEEYNETKLKKKFKTQAFGQNIGKTKYLLYQLLLKSLRPLYNSKCLKSTLEGNLQSVDFLISKGLYQQAASLLVKAKKQATHYQVYPNYLKVLGYEKQLVGFVPAKALPKNITALLEEYEDVAGKVRTEMRYRSSVEKLHFCAMIYDKEKWMDVLAEELGMLQLDEIPSEATFLSKVLRRELLALEAFAEGENQKAADLLRAVFLLWEQNSHLTAIFSADFTRTIQSYIRYSLLLSNQEKQLEEILLFLFKVKSLHSEEEAAKIELQYYTLDFIIHLTKGNREICGIQVINIAENLEMIKNFLSIPLQTQLYYHIGVYYFLKRDFVEMLEWVGKTKEISNEKIYPRTQRFSKLMELIARYEMGEYEYLDSAIRSMYRSLRQEARKNEIESLVLQSVKKLINVSNQSEVGPIFIRLHDSLQKIDPAFLLNDDLQTNLLYAWINKHLPQENQELFN